MGFVTNILANRSTFNCTNSWRRVELYNFPLSVTTSRPKPSHLRGLSQLAEFLTMGLAARSGAGPQNRLKPGGRVGLPQLLAIMVSNTILLFDQMISNGSEKSEIEWSSINWIDEKHQNFSHVTSCFLDQLLLSRGLFSQIPTLGIWKSQARGRHTGPGWS